MTTITDIPYLFTAADGQAMKDKKVVESLFPMNSSYNFDKLKLTDDGACLAVIITAKDGGDIMREEIFEDILILDELIRNFTAHHQSYPFKFQEVCAKNNGDCIINEGLELAAKVTDFRRGKYSFKYPLDIDPLILTFNMYSFNLGGVIVDDKHYVKEVKTFRLLYFLDDTDKYKEELSNIWEDSVIQYIDESEFQHINVYRFGSSSYGEEINQFTRKVMPLGGVSAFVILLFSIVTLMTTDVIKSKPWLGLAGCFSSCLSVITAFGLVMACGIEYSDLNVALPFLILGMGIDDSYVLIAAWRRSKITNTVEERMGETFAEAAVSISITSLTNFLSFCIGIITPFPVVHLFCIYAATAVLFTYVYQITFFGGCMALSGLREERELHPFTCRRVVKAKRKTTISRYVVNDARMADHFLMRFFANTLGHYLSRGPVKIAVIMMCIGNLMVALWGLTTIEEGLDAKDSFTKNSQGRKFLDLHYQYYTEYPYRLHVVINETLDYSNSTVQESIENLLHDLEATTYIADAWLSQSWLRNFTYFIKTPGVASYSLAGFNLEEKEDFIYALKHIFFRFPQTKLFRSDIILNDEETDILASRFILLCENVKTKNAEKTLLTEVRDVVSKSSIPVTVHSAWFPVYEQIIAVRSMAIHTICVAAGVVMVAFFLFAPNLKCAFCVTIIVALVEIETIGYMALWDVHLDLLSVICLVMCVGFSVNYPAHVTYAYVTSPGRTADEKMKGALYAIGLPIFQGSISTVLGVAILAINSSYFIVLFYKIITLVVLFTAFHALFVLPVVLTLCVSCKNKENTREHFLEDNGISPAPESSKFIVSNL
ncbi:patched domain-containing protein 3-like [Centruroides sculpturatus]|uniref:patched domain-containing protein 3-like n=1 Tax=Centruroides sculpturatus TaxID=218467 RepID=UPI000C6E8D3F|nr:patched domain-containing protein 3-like [Centruroides sculpturatus]